jgi:hypothetical protein
VSALIAPVAVLDLQNFAWMGLFPIAICTIALIINVSSLQTKDMNRKSCLAANVLFVAFIIEAAAWTVRAFGGGSENGVFWAVIVAAFLHIASAAVALRAWWEHRTIGRWPYGRRRATCGFFLNVVALLGIAAWFHLCANPKLFKRIFE